MNLNVLRKNLNECMHFKQIFNNWNAMWGVYN